VFKKQKRRTSQRVPPYAAMPFANRSIISAMLSFPNKGVCPYPYRSTFI